MSCDISQISPPLAIFAGRCLWQPEHLLQAAQNLGLLTDELWDKLFQEVER